MEQGHRQGPVGKVGAAQFLRSTETRQDRLTIAQGCYRGEWMRLGAVLIAAVLACIVLFSLLATAAAQEADTGPPGDSAQSPPPSGGDGGASANATSTPPTLPTPPPGPAAAAALDPPPAPGSFSASVTGRTSVSLSWQVQSGVGAHHLAYRVNVSGQTWTRVDLGAAIGSHDLSGLTCGTSYRFSVKARGDGTTYEREWGEYATTTASTNSCPTPLPLPPAPSGFSASATGKSVQLTWETRSGVNGYYIAYKVKDSGPQYAELARPGGTDSSYDVSGLDCATTYRFAIKGYGDGQTYSQVWGPYAYVEVDTCPTPPPAPAPPGDDEPGKPQNVTYTPDGDEAGKVKLSWGAAANATAYEVRQGLCTQPNSCVYSTIQTLGSDVTAATVSGLATDRLHKFIVRATKGDLSTDSDEITVNLRPAPQNLQGLYVIGQYGKITLKWDPVPNPDATYTVEQQYPMDDPWLELPSTSVSTATMDSAGRMTAVVSGLLYGETYSHRVRASSVQGVSEPSNVDLTTATDERPQDPPTGLLAKDMIGFRGVELTWVHDATAFDGYEIETEPHDSSVAIGTVKGQGSARISYVIGLDPGTIYTFKVYGKKGTLQSARPAEVLRVAPVPTYWWGHQADHTVGYTIGTITEPLVQTAIPSAIATWNGRMNFGLEICDTSDTDCRDNKNTDGFIATIKTVRPSSSSDNSTGCGSSMACVRPTGQRIDAPGGVGAHMTNMDVIFEDPPYACTRSTNPCAPANQRTYEWTDDTNKSHKPVNPKDQTHRYLHAEQLVLHELGHTLGLPDFYLIRPLTDHPATNYDVRLHGEKAIMKYQWDAKSIQDTDIAQLDAIYRRHSSHPASSNP